MPILWALMHIYVILYLKPKTSLYTSWPLTLATEVDFTTQCQLTSIRYSFRIPRENYPGVNRLEKGPEISVVIPT